MWLGLFGLLIVVIALAAGFLAGGIYTIVLIPVAVILLVPTAMSLLRRRGSEGPGDTRRERARLSASLPRHHEPGVPADQPAATPDDILAARRRQTY